MPEDCIYASSNCSHTLIASDPCSRVSADRTKAFLFRYMQLLNRKSTVVVV